MLSTFLFSQHLLEMPVRLSLQKTSLAGALDNLEKGYGLQFSYGKLDLSPKTTLEFSGPLHECLAKILTPNHISFEVVKTHIVLRPIPLSGRTIKGRILDKDTQMPLIGASIVVLGSSPLRGADADVQGYFEIGELPIGRYDFQVQYLGYEPLVVSQVLNSSGKEVFLDLELTEATMSFVEVTVLDQTEYGEPLHEMAMASARSFSVEETQRFAAAISDPARMAQAYAGVSSGGDDLSNEIIIRGNSTRGLLWRLEGVEVPNPNHFGGMGNGGGAVSMLSASTLTNSDFYTGAFPAEFGNAISGVFDLRMRNGNTDNREHSLAIGNLGIEASTEGFLKKGSKASYLINYRYSTIKFIRRWLPSVGNEIPNYRDLSFKFNLPTENAGNFAVFGLGGKNFSERTGIRDSLQWNDFDDASDLYEEENVGVLGVTHRLLLSDDAYIKSSVAGTVYDFYDRTNLLLRRENYPDTLVDESDFTNVDFSGYFSFHKKINARNKIRAGFIISHKSFSYDYLTVDNFLNYILFFRNKGNTQFLQTYFQWKKRLHEKWEINSGLHFSYLFLNNTYALDPRASLKWLLRPKQTLTLSAGIHSKPEHLSTYFIENILPSGTITSPNLRLKMLKAVHLVLGYSRAFDSQLKLTVETYYQYLFNIPVSEDPNSGFSVLNNQDVFDIIVNNNFGRVPLISEGIGENYGTDLTLERPFSNGYYFLFTGSVFDAKYATLQKKKYHAITANNYILNLLAGKEWKLGSRQKNVLGLNGKFTFYGGRRDTPVNLPASRAAGFQVLEEDSYFSERLPHYLRLDVGCSYKINIRRQTHTLRLDIQNVTNRFNVLDRFYDGISQGLSDELQNGLIPFLVYRVEI
ncbi:MAG: TonB-dependent receptor [Bacteroidota bacterium]